MSGPAGSSQWMYQAGEDYTIDYSCRFNATDSPHLSKSFSSNGNRKTFSISCWFKRGKFGSTSGNDSGNYNICEVRGGSAGDQIVIRDGDDSSAIQIYLVDGTYILNTDQLFRDPTAWYHLLLAVDTTQGTASDRVKFYINGSQVTSFSSASYPTQNLDMNFNASSGTHYIGRQGQSTLEYWDGYMAEFHWVDGTAELPSAFGETGDYGEWKPKSFSGSYGTNGFYLDFADSGNLGDDESGNGNDWTENNIAATDQMLDTPTNNFCTLNPLEIASDTLLEGNLKTTGGQDYTWNKKVGSTMSTSTTKIYFEVYQWRENGESGGTGGHIGISPVGTSLDNRHYNDGGAHYSIEEGAYYINASYTSGQTSGQADVTGMCAYDPNTGKVWFGIDGTWNGSGNPATGANPAGTISMTDKEMMPFLQPYNTGFVANFGQDSSFAAETSAGTATDSNGYGSFKYTPPTDFLALCSANLSDPAVTPSEHFNTVIYSGTGSAQSISGVGFQPDFVWFKGRSHNDEPRIMDAVRGLHKTFKPHQAVAEDDDETNGLTGYNADGVSLGDQSVINASGHDYVVWNWKANGSGSANTTGSINSTVSVNQDAGFSIVSYTGTGSNATVGHGLSQSPDMIIIKDRTSGNDWHVYHKDLASANYSYNLNNETGQGNVGSTLFNSTHPTSTVFSLGSEGDVNTDTNNYIAYCFHSVEGFSKFGKYYGNGNADGTFVYLGFKPNLLVCRNIENGGADFMWDMLRDGYNVDNDNLRAAYNSAENTDDDIDLLSNGFKFRTTNTEKNQNDAVHTYWAFAETPFKYANAR